MPTKVETASPLRWKYRISSWTMARPYHIPVTLLFADACLVTWRTSDPVRLIIYTLGGNTYPGSMLPVPQTHDSPLHGAQEYPDPAAIRPYGGATLPAGCRQAGVVYTHPLSLLPYRQAQPRGLLLCPLFSLRERRRSVLYGA